MVDKYTSSPDRQGSAPIRARRILRGPAKRGSDRWPEEGPRLPYGETPPGPHAHERPPCNGHKNRASREKSEARRGGEERNFHTGQGFEQVYPQQRKFRELLR